MTLSTAQVTNRLRQANMLYHAWLDSGLSEEKFASLIAPELVKHTAAGKKNPELAAHGVAHTTAYALMLIELGRKCAEKASEIEGEDADFGDVEELIELGRNLGKAAN